MKLSRLTCGLAALLLAACSPQGRPMPELQDTAEIKAAIASLSPFEDGRPAVPDADPVSDEPGSDRALFKTWLFRYVANNEYKRDPDNFDPVPATIGDAIASERVIQEKGRIAAAVRDAELERRRAEQEAATALRQQQYAEDAARAEAKAAAERTRGQAIYKCRMDRQEAASAAVQLPGGTENGSYQRTWDSFDCPDD